MKRLFVSVLFTYVVAACQPAETPPARPEAVEAHHTDADFDSADRIDFHTHIHAADGEFVDRAREDRFRFVNIAQYVGRKEVEFLNAAFLRPAGAPA